jgi:hypothetical protein
MLLESRNHRLGSSTAVNCEYFTALLFGNGQNPLERARPQRAAILHSARGRVAGAVPAPFGCGVSWAMTSSFHWCQGARISIFFGRSASNRSSSTSRTPLLNRAWALSGSIELDPLAPAGAADARGSVYAPLVLRRLARRGHRKEGYCAKKMRGEGAIRKFGINPLH